VSEIVIRIQIPDGSTVSTGGGRNSGRASNGGGNKPFVERPAPPQPDGYCEVHDMDWKLVPAGVSRRTGNRYNAFWACPENGCTEKPAFKRDEDSAIDDLGF
jgi:hypothetical protein